MSVPSHLELGVPRGSVARAFYEKLFDWTFHDMPNDNCWAETKSGRVGVHARDEDRCFVIYFATDDIEAAVARVRELGGEAQDPSGEIDDFGRFSECRDPQGVRFGLHQRQR